MDDGADLAATLYLPGGAAPAGGWPAVVFLHGLGGNRSQMNTLAESMGLRRRAVRGADVRRARPRRSRAG